MKTNWPIEKFENCIESVKYTTKIPSKDYKETGKFPIISQEEDLISGFWDDEADVYKIKKPIVIFGDHTKVIKYIDFDFVLGADGVKILQPKDFLDAKFFMYFLKNANIKSLGYARHYRLLKELNVPLPPLEEQKRIVAVLDKKFAQIETLKTAAEKNLQNTKQLFQAELEKAFSNTSWEKKSLGDVCKIIGGGTPSKKNKNFYTGNIPWASVRDMSTDELSKTEFCITENAIKESSTNIIPKGNVIIATRVGLGKVCILQQDTAINQDLKGIIPKKENFLENLYLFYFFKSKANFIISNGVGATVHGVKLSFIQELAIPLPPLEEQKRIVAHLDSLSEKVHQLEEIYKKQLADCDELKQSLLQKAFEGEL